MDKRLILEPLHGLANRLRAIASGLALLEADRNLTLELVWRPDAGLAASFSELFEPIDHPRFTIGRIEDHPIFDAYTRPGRLGWRKVVSLAREHPKVSKSESMELPDIRLDGARLYTRIGSKIILSTCHEFYSPGDWSYFHPLPLLQDRIDAITTDFGPDCIGIHIRRTDHAGSCEHSPLDAFLTAMEEERSKHPAARFFLATDSDDIRTALVHIFGDAVITQAHPNLARSTKSGIEDALVDIWCLSRTARILGSHRSSFSRAAALIGDVPFTRCCSMPVPQNGTTAAV